MKTLLLSGFGNNISVDKRKLIISNKLEKSRLEFYPHQISYDSIIIDGNYGMITFEAIRWLMKHDITLTTLNWNGNLLSTTLPKEPTSGKLKLKQYEKYLNNNERRKIALSILDEKVKNSLNLLITLSDYYKGLSKEEIITLFERESADFKRNLKNNEEFTKKSLNRLLTYEARIADIYWSSLKSIFTHLAPEFNFKSRQSKSYSWNNNASDEVNALLNYGYALLESIIRKDINTVGLDLTIGFLHEPAQSKTPLVYDLQELYRWLVDLSVIQLLEERKLKKSDFTVTENYNIRLKATASKALLDKLTSNLNQTVEYRSKLHSYEFILLDNVRNLANYIADNKITLSFEIPTFIINRSDTKELRNTILQITPEDRKRLGINKSTLWYQQKALREGRKIKVYLKVKNKIS